MKVEPWPLDRLQPSERNPRRIDEAVDAVRRSIERFGWRQPIVATSDGEIVAGHVRLAAATEMGLDEVPVHVADDLSEAEIRAYRLADNRTGELAAWDLPMLEAELGELEALPEIALEDFGFAALDGLADSVSPIADAPAKAPPAAAGAPPLYSGQFDNQHGDVKISMRRSAAAEIGPGAIWIPYCGSGEMAAAVPPERQNDIQACDVDAAHVRRFGAALPTATVTEQDTLTCDLAALGEIAYADIDPYGGAWAPLMRLVEDGTLADVCHVVITDHTRQALARGKRPVDVRTGRMAKRIDSDAALAQRVAWPAPLIEAVRARTDEPVHVRGTSRRKWTDMVWLQIGGAEAPDPISFDDAETAYHRRSTEGLRRHLWRLYARQTPRSAICPECGEDLPEDPHAHGDTDLPVVEVDHVIPRSAGGSDSIDNLQALHVACNENKGARVE